MSYGTFFGLNTALRGLMAQQSSLDVTSHNIANANTEGYSRQRAELRATIPLSVPGFNSVLPGQIGTGVEVASFERLRDAFVDRTLREELARYGDASTTLGALDQLEAAFAEPGDSGLSASLKRFFSALDQVAAHPEDSAARQAFGQMADALAHDFNQLSTDLVSIRQQSDDRLNNQVTEINNISARIAALNTTIGAAVTAGQQPNDLLDERDRLLDDLAHKVDFTYSVNSLNQVTIVFDTNVPINLVDPTTVGPPAGYTVIARADLDTAFTAPPQQLTSGEVFADETLFNTTIPFYQQRLDDLAASIVNRFNALSAGGFDLTGAAGGDIFDAAQLTAGTIRLDLVNNILNNPNLIAAASSWLAPGEPGNGNNAILMLSERALIQIAPLGATWENFYNATVTDLGTRTEQAGRNNQNQAVLTESLQGRRAETAGVSMDEEMSNMLRFQHAYNASARVLTALDDALDTLINRMGRVGL